MRIGFSRDVHRFTKDRPLILGGIIIPYSMGLLGHSDGDVVLHSVAEAIYGALALGDLGSHFSDRDPKNKGMNSEIIVIDAVKKMEERNFEINNVDILVVCEKPRLADHVLKIRTNIARLLKTDVENVSFKASTNEGLDEVGKNKAIISYTSVLLKEKE